MNKLTQQTKRTITYLVTALAIFAMGSDARAHEEHGKYKPGDGKECYNGYWEGTIPCGWETGVSHYDVHKWVYDNPLPPPTPTNPNAPFILPPIEGLDGVCGPDAVALGISNDATCGGREAVRVPTKPLGCRPYDTDLDCYINRDRSQGRKGQ